MSSIVLARRGEGGYRQYRIPALACTPQGTLLAIYDGRVDLDDLPGPIDLVVRRSYDNGKSWSPQEVFRRGEGVQGFGDASILIDPTVGDDGKIMVFAQESQLAGFFESRLGSDESDPAIVQITLSESVDDGKTWHHRRITHQLKDEKTHGIFVTSGTGGRITTGPFAGRLLHACVLRRDRELLGALIYSDDHGQTWTLGAQIPGGNETAVAGRSDGSILLHSRATPYRIAATSDDGGATLSKQWADTHLPDPSDNGSLLALSDGSLICSHNHDVDQRRNTVLKRSFDGGATWPMAVRVCEGSSAYSTTCELPDGSIGILFERAGYTEMVFSRITLDQFQPAEQVLAPGLDSNGFEFEVELRFIRPSRNSHVLQSLAENARRWMPEVDMSAFAASSRKEIGEASGSTSGDPIFTREEYLHLLGPITPQLKAGDEIRFSLRLQSYASIPLYNVEISLPEQMQALRQEVLKPGSKIVDLDLRIHVSDSDVENGVVRARFRWSGELDNDGKPTAVSGAHEIEISLDDGVVTTSRDRL